MPAHSTNLSEALTGRASATEGRAQVLLARAEHAYERARHEQAHGSVRLAREWTTHGDSRFDEYIRARERARRLRSLAYATRTLATEA